MVSALESSTQNSLLGGLLGGDDTVVVPKGKVTTEEAAAILTSRRFIENFINDNKLLPILFAESWDKKERKWKLDLDSPPTLLDGYELMVDSLEISYDDSLITLELFFASQEEVAEILNSLIFDVNSYIRNRSINESEKNIAFLQQEISKTQLSASRDMLYRIVEQQTQSIMIANTREDYAFKVIDPGVKPIQPAGPNRKLIVIIATILGLVLSCLYVLFSHFISISRKH
tara:strand:+ start:283 stop:972 length:690 start_codon:yes stop_codon:yes gene_type:complete